MATSIRSTIKYGFLFIVTVIVISGIMVRNKYPNVIGDLLKPVSVVSQVTSTGELKSADGRTNILILGLDKRSASNGNVTSVLTDTIIVVSLDKEGEKPVIISIPRDLWLDETQSKINAVYTLSRLNKSAELSSDIISAEQSGDTAKVLELKAEVNEHSINTTINATERIVGIPIHYYVLIGFDAFSDSIDAVGGIDLYVNEAFDDYQYPIEGKENAMPESERYMHIHFDQGWQHMNSEAALQYSRSRHSTNPNEQGDFARARRQQKVMIALKDSLVSTETLFNPSTLKDLYNSYDKNIKSDVTLADAILFYDVYQDATPEKITKITLSNEPRIDSILGSGTLLSAEKEIGDLTIYVLIPVDGNFGHIHGMIRTELFK